jgi:hypothetical protein
MLALNGYHSANGVSRTASEIKKSLSKPRQYKYLGSHPRFRVAVPGSFATGVEEYCKPSCASIRVEVRSNVLCLPHFHRTARVVPLSWIARACLVSQKRYLCPADEAGGR